MSGNELLDVVGVLKSKLGSDGNQGNGANLSSLQNVNVAVNGGSRLL